MAEGDSVADRGIRVRLDGNVRQGDVGALKNWLEREQPLEQLVRDGRLRIQERAGTDEHGTPMGVGMEILLTMVGAATTAVFAEVLKQVRQAVEAWQANRREVEDGDPPDSRVDPVDPDAR